MDPGQQPGHGGICRGESSRDRTHLPVGGDHLGVSYGYLSTAFGLNVVARISSLPDAKSPPKSAERLGNFNGAKEEDSRGLLT